MKLVGGVCVVVEEEKERWEGGGQLSGNIVLILTTD